MSERTLDLSLLLAVMALGCGGGGPSEGTCTGAVGEVALDVAIDAEVSQTHVLYAASCAEASLTVLTLSYGGGALRLHGELPSANVKGIVAYTEGSYSVVSPGVESVVRAWSLEAPSPAPALLEGTLHVSRSHPPRLEGSFDLRFADESQLACNFDLRQGDSEGERPDCGGGGGDD